MRELATHAGDLARRYPCEPAGWVFLGYALESLGQLDPAARALRQAVMLRPQVPEHRTHLGWVLQRLLRYDEAVALYRQALALAPGHRDALLRLAQLHTERNELAQADETYAALLREDPSHAQAWFQRGVLASWQGKWQQAERGYRAALALQPGVAVVLDALSHALLEQGRAGEALAQAREALAAAPDQPDLVGNLLFTRNYVGGLPPDTPAEQARYADVMARAWGSAPRKMKREAPQRLRVGLVSGDFRRHAVSTFLPAILDRPAGSTVDYHAYATHTVEDAVTATLKPHMKAWRQIAHCTAAEAARQISDDGIDVLVDLSGHSGHGRLDVFALRPAAVQVAWLGYPATTALPQMDFLLTAPHASAPGDALHFTERLWPLAASLFCYTPPVPDIPIGEPPLRANGFITFGSFNNLPKLGDPVVRAWSRILHQVPGSRLYLRALQFTEEPLRQAVAARFLNHGIGAERLLIEGPIASLAEHLADYNSVDIALDPFPFGGGTTTVEAAYMGVPAVTLRGPGNLLRLGESVLQQLQLGDWIAQDEAAYVALAADAARQPDRLARLRTGLRASMRSTPLLDAALFRPAFEQALWDMWRAAAA